MPTYMTGITLLLHYYAFDLSITIGKYNYTADSLLSLSERCTRTIACLSLNWLLFFSVELFKFHSWSD